VGRMMSSSHRRIAFFEKASLSSMRMRLCSGSSMPMTVGPTNAVRLGSYQRDENVDARRNTSVQPA
jgi:hypothetical protein